MYELDEPREARMETRRTDPGLLIWQATAAALFVVWIFTFAFFYFSSQLASWQSLGVLKSEIITAVQQLGQQQQELSRRVQALEAK